MCIVPPPKAGEQYERTAILYHQQYTSKLGVWCLLFGLDMGAGVCAGRTVGVTPTSRVRPYPTILTGLSVGAMTDRRRRSAVRLIHAGNSSHAHGECCSRELSTRFFFANCPLLGLRSLRVGRGLAPAVLHRHAVFTAELSGHRYVVFNRFWFCFGRML